MKKGVEIKVPFPKEAADKIGWNWPCGSEVDIQNNTPAPFVNDAVLHLN